MHFYTVVAAVAGILAGAPVALSTITITGPSPPAYWVENVSNQITWEYSQGDPTPITITVTNTDNRTLNGLFAIAENVDLSNKSFTVTNVTLKVASGYTVNFVNTKNITQVYASSGTFDVKPPGTATVPQSVPPAATATSPAGTGNGTATASGAAGSATGTKKNGAVETTGRWVAGMAGMAGVVGMVGLWM